MRKVLQLDSKNLKNLHSLRAEVLRPGLPIKSSYYSEDTHQSTIHLAFKASDNQLCSIATFIKESSPLFAEEHQYRLRGMATAKDHRKRGLGSSLLHEAFNILKEKEVNILWCNARVLAISFYKKLGFETIGEQFDIPRIGPHFVMKKLL